LSSIRVTYTGLIGFVVSIISVITGLMFTVLVTRKLTPEEFGLWALIGSMIAYFLIMEPIVSYWTTREIARGKSVGTTSLITSSLFALCSIPLYIVASFFVSDLSQTSFNVMLFGIMLIPCFFISQTLVGINQGHKPHATSYGTLVFESLKIPVGLGLVFYLQWGVEGAIVTTLLAYIARMIIQFYYARTKLKPSLDFYLIKNWFRLAPITLYSNLSHFIWSLDVVLFAIITSSSVGIAYYTICLAIASVIGHSTMISQALYPKLLSGGSHEYVNENILRLFYFAIPLLGITIMFAKPSLFILNPIYDGLFLVVIFLAIRTFFYVINGVFYQILLGIETVDKNYENEFTKFLKSRLFSVPTIQNIHYTLYIVILVISVVFLSQNDYEIKEMVIVWSIISAALSIPFVIYTGMLVKRNVKFSLPVLEIGKYGFGTIILVITFMLTSDYILDYEASFFEFIPGVILELLICAGSYVCITYLIDRKTRKFLKAIITEVVLKK